MDTNLNAVDFGNNKYCGPSVMSILTGIDTDEAERLLRLATGRYNITGVQPQEMKMALLLMEPPWDMVSVAMPLNSSLYFTLTQLYKVDGLYIIGVPGHVITIEVKERKIYLCDNHTKTPIPAGNSARLSQHVTGVYKIGPKPMPIGKLIRKYVVPQVGL